MPRTKVRALTENNGENIKPNRSKLDQEMINSYLKALNNEVAEVNLKLQSKSKEIMVKLDSALKEECLKFPHSLSKTMTELKFEKPQIESLFETMSHISVNSTRTARKAKNHDYTSSTAKGEGSRDDTLLRSRTQSNIKKAKNTRASRSLSRNKLQQALTMNSYNTPASQNISTGTFGLVTPKVKPNTPQVMLRRPKQGEIALSMQGSPLMVGSITSDQEANVNIPLQDGRVLSIQPQRGLRTSQIPDFDPETKRQIETLRDNLNKVCALTARR